jgi:GT2 family glycosyltransferase
VSPDPGDLRPRVAIILVTYYMENRLERLYDSIVSLQYPRDRRTLIVVDNAPDRSSAQWFAAHAPEVRVITPGENTGYAGGNAIGMREALAMGVDYVAILTQDILPDPAWLHELLEVAAGHPRAAVIQPKILRRDERGAVVVNSWGNDLHFLGIGVSGGDGQPDRPLEVREVGYASGASLICRATALRRVGPFDPVYFMYHEDSDLSWRCRIAGYEVLVAPRAVVHHDYDFGRNPDKLFYVERNRLINLLTHYRWRTLLLLAPALCAFEGMMLAHSLWTGWLRKRLSVYGFFLRSATWAYLRRKRRHVQSLRLVSDREIAKHLTGTIQFAVLDSFLLRYVVNPIFRVYWGVVRRLIT